MAVNESQPPEALAEILSKLFAARGWGRRQERLRLERAWEEAAGPEVARQSRVNALRRGVLEVEVASAVLVQELASFHKRRLLEALRRVLAGRPAVNDIRFRSGAPGPAPGQTRGA
jgi:predicted nucleic acid-binding Zn ribbon protein